MRDWLKGKQNREQNRVRDGVALGVLGAIFTIGGISASSDGGLIGIAIGVVFLVAAGYQFVVAAIAQGVAEGRDKPN